MSIIRKEIKMIASKTEIKGPEIVETGEKAVRFLFSEETWVGLGVLSLRIFVIIVLASVIVKVGKLFINRVFSLKIKGPIRKSERREKTLLRLLENGLSYVIYFSAILAILTEFSIDVKGLLAGAGVLGLAIGFGAQSLVKDVISGFFILFEDQFSIGDYVMIGTTVGTVEEIGIRTTKIQAYGGEIHIIPNGNIQEVVNYSIRNSLVILDIGIAYEMDLNKIESLLTNFLNNLPDHYEELIGVPTLIGIQNLEPSQVVLRITAETKPVMNYSAARKLRKDLKNFMDANGIEIPYPKMVTFHKTE